MNPTNPKAHAIGRCLTALAAACVLSFSSQVSFASECASLSVDPANFSAAGDVDRYEAANPAGNAADNNKATRFSARWSGQGSGVQLNVDLQKAKTLCNMNVSWFKGGVDGRQYEFNIATSNDNQTFKNVFQGKSALHDNFQQYNFARTNARYVRLTVKGNNKNLWTSINEVKLGGHEIQAPVACNLIGPRGNTMFSGQQEGHPAKDAVDGRQDTYWAVKGFPSHLTLNYDKPFEHCHAVVKWQFGGLYGRTHDFEIRGSDDGKNFNKLLYAGTSLPNSEYQRYSFKPQTARYIRLLIKSNNARERNEWVSVSEFAMYARPANGTNPNPDPKPNPNPNPNPGTGFKHPGVVLDWAQISRVKQKIKQGGWHKTEFQIAHKHSFPNGIRIDANPPSTLYCKSGDNNPCAKTRDHALHAYTAALGWAYTGDKRYANAAIKVLNTYADRNVQVKGGHNRQLQKAWMGEMFAKTAEIIRHTNAGWPEHRAKKFGRWMNSALLPEIRNGWYDPGNWASSMINASIAIAVYNDDRDLFNYSIKMWKNTLPSSIYLKSDGSKPNAFSPYQNGKKQRPIAIELGPLNKYGKDKRWRTYWGTLNLPHSGHITETCRDTGHAVMSLNSYTESAQTAYIQGVDLFQHGHKRLIAGYENLSALTLKYGNPDKLDPKAYRLVGNETGMCDDGQIVIEYFPAMEIGYAHYQNHYGDAFKNKMGKTKKYLELLRRRGKEKPSGKGITRFRANHFHSAWPYLTHGVDNL